MMALVLKHIFEPQLGGHLDEVLKLASGVAMVLTLLRYIGRAATRIDRSEMAEKLLTYLPREGGILMETMAQEWNEFLQLFEVFEACAAICELISS